MDNQNFSASLDQIPDQTPVPELSPKSKRAPVLIGLILLIVAIVIGAFSLWVSQGKSPVAAGDLYKPATALASNFAVYTETPVNITPRIPAYSVDQDLKNVSNLSDLTLSAEAKNLLAKNAFAVQQGYSREFYPLYESNRYSLIPSFITTDSMLHNYHLVFDFLLKKLEEDKLASELKSLNAVMLAEALSQYDNLKGTEWENAAKRNVGFFAVGSKLLDPSVETPVLVKNEVEHELALVAGHRGIAVSPLMNIGSDASILDALKEDYSQYIPRGHYDKTEQLKAYFKSMMWYGRLTFRLKNEDETKSGILITLALDKGNNLSGWNKIYEPTNFFVGKSDDITYYQFRDLVAKIYGKNISDRSVAGDKNKLDAFIAATKTLEPPQINSIPIFNTEIQPDREKEIKGFRFMGQRFTVDASIFQRLIDREVPGRMLPKGLDIPAAFGSAEALGILTEAGDTKYPKYSDNMTNMRSYVAGLSTEAWTQNLYWGWMYTLRPLTEQKPVGYPIFMQNSAWARKDLNTFLGSWTELKHDTILYAKQVYAELGGGGPDQRDDRGYVEPEPYVYARLASLIKMTSAGLEDRDLLSASMKDNLGKLSELALSLKSISEKELNNEKLTDADYELIRSYGGQLEHFWLEVNKDEPQFKEMNSPRNYLNENPAALVADVATDPNGQVLEEATGNIAEIYVIVPIDGQLRIAKGGVYSYYEFPWPMSDRLTDKKWRELVNTRQTPPMPAWTGAFVAK